jgi:molybdopterin converting factor subunit 1
VRVQVLFFAAYREAVGRSRQEMDIPDEATAGELYDLLEASSPRLEALRPYTTFAVNREVVEPTQKLRPDDEVAFLQPVSGGHM